MEVAVLFKHLVEQSTVAMYLYDTDGHICLYNDAAARLWGMEPNENILWSGAWKLFDANHKAMPPEQSPMARAVQERSVFNGEMIHIETPDHSVRKVLTFSNPVFDKFNMLIGGQTIMVDITGTETIESKQAFLSAIVESSDDAIISKDLKGFITSWNHGAQLIFGYTEEEAIGKHITMLIPPSRLSEENNILSNIRAGKKVDHFETIRLNKFGKEIPISLTVSPIKDTSGKIIGASKIARNISERLLAEQMIKESNINLEILNSIGNLISEKLDSSFVLQRVIDATAKITGATVAAFLSNNSPDAVPLYADLTEKVQLREDFARCINTGIIEEVFSTGNIMLVADTYNDEKFAADTTAPFRSFLGVPVIDLSGNITGGLFFGHLLPGTFKPAHLEMLSSIASQAAVALDNAKLFEEVNKLSAKKDEFIALASHELKTPLTTIKGYLQILSKYGLKSPEKQFVEKSLTQVDRLYLLIEELLDVSKIEAGKLQLHPEQFNLLQLIKEVADNMGHIEPSHSILLDNNGCEPFITADKQRIEQVLINLLSNAIKYSPKADKVYVTLRSSAGTVTVGIRDEGIGIAATDKSKLFNRFFRAESIKNISGLGLGLYLTNEIIQRHGGDIEVNSEPGKGSEFTFTLPVNLKSATNNN